MIETWHRNTTCNIARGNFSFWPGFPVSSVELISFKMFIMYSLTFNLKIKMTFEIWTLTLPPHFPCKFSDKTRGFKVKLSFYLRYRKVNVGNLVQEGLRSKFKGLGWKRFWWLLYGDPCDLHLMISKKIWIRKVRIFSRSSKILEILAQSCEEVNFIY